MINGEAKNCYCFAIKILLELYSLGWFRGKKEAIINGDKCFQNALNDALNYQNIEKNPQRISKTKSYVVSIIRKGQNFQRRQKTG